MTCIHCRQNRANRPRNLCWTCYYTPHVSAQYGSTSKYARIGSGLRYQGPPPEPTLAAPGTPEKFAVLTDRAAAGHDLHHPDDFQPR